MKRNARLVNVLCGHLLPGAGHEGDVSHAVQPREVGDAELQQLLEVGGPVDVHQDLQENDTCLA